MTNLPILYILLFKAEVQVLNFTQAISVES